MRAAWYTMNGQARDVINIGDLPTPAPGPGEVRVMLMTSGVNPSDVKSRRARPMTDALIVPHSDGAGVIDAVGAGVHSVTTGDRVWVWNGQWQRPLGTAATAIVLPQAQAVALPDNTDFAAGACLGIPAMTAWHAVSLLGDIRGKSVLIVGAGSAVGHYATQMAVLAGAQVIGTVGSPEKARHAGAAGVATIIDYKTEAVAARVRELTAGRGADAIIDMDFSHTATLLTDGVLAAHGTLVCYGSNVNANIGIPFLTALFNSLSLRFFLVYDLLPAARLAALAGLSQLLQRGQLAHTIGARFTLNEIVAAHEAVEQGKVVGNVVIDLAP